MNITPKPSLKRKAILISHGHNYNTSWVVYKKKSNERAVNNLFSFTFLFEMVSMFMDTCLSSGETCKRRKIPCVCFISLANFWLRHDSFSLLSALQAQNLIFKYPHRRRVRGFKSGEQAGQETGASTSRPIQRPAATTDSLHVCNVVLHSCVETRSEDACSRTSLLILRLSVLEEN
jgi:hypothetical protein